MSTGLAVAGARIVVMGRTQSDLDETVAVIEAEGGEALAVRADVADYDALPAWWRRRSTASAASTSW